MKSVIFHPNAEAEFDNTISFYEKRQTGLGLDFKNEILRSISVIHDAPQRWPFYKFGLKKYTLHRFPFTIFYLDELECIWIVAIAHNFLRPDYWKERLAKKP